MPDKNDLENPMNTFLTNYKEFAHLHNSLTLIRSNDRIPYSKMMYKSLWTNMLDHSDKQIEYYSAKLKEVSQILFSLTNIREKSDSINELNKSIKPISIRISDWEKERELLVEKLVSQDLSPEKANKYADFIGNLGGKYIHSLFKNTIARKEQLVGKYLLPLMISMSGAILARSVAMFNIEAAKQIPNCSIGDIQKWYKSTIGKLVRLEKRIYTGLSKDDKTPNYYSGIIQKSKEILTEGTVFAAQCSTLLNSTNDTDRQKLYDLSWKIGDILRYALRISNIAIYIDTITQDPTGSLYSKWSKAAKKLEFKPIRVQTGKTISGLRADKSLIDGSPITVQGIISNIVIVKLRNKNLSLVKMTEDYGNTITVVLPYINFDSAGAAVGSYIRLSGKYYKDVLQRHLKSIPDEYKEALENYCVDGIEIDRMNYSDLSKNNWNYWSVSNIKPFFDSIPHGLELSWSWIAGSNGAGNQLCYGTWYKQ